MPASCATRRSARRDRVRHVIDNFSNTQVVRKSVVATRGGVVAAQHRRAAEAGAAVLEAGGDAIDAAVAVSFAIGVVEPWMSGPAAGGAMTLWRAGEGRAYTVDYGMRSPMALDPADYPLSGAGKASDLFPWAAVVDDRNVQGAAAVAVPGVVAGMGLAHERFGRLPWRDLLQPAVALAEEGLLVDWFSGLLMASSARALAQDPDAAALFLEDGQWPILGQWTALTQRHLDQKAHARTLRHIADGGAQAFYAGDLAQALAGDVRAKGGCLSVADLAAYRARIVDALPVPYRGGHVFVAPGMTGGPTLAKSLQLLSGMLASPGGAPGPASYVAYARALDAAYRSRLDEMGDRESPAAPSCTTHFSIVDRHGNLCAATQTLLSMFGSRVVSPSLGILLNNGIMWFDPEPGKPNSLGPNQRCLGNFCPVVGEIADGRRFALGASGGRKIIGTVLQIASFMMDHAQTLEEAFHQPRIDQSGGTLVIADMALPADVLAALREHFSTVTARRTCFPYAFAVPAGVVRDGQWNTGCTEIMSPWGDAVAERGP
jgi:gamma-glutamyltranspeptidase/glutathione hydrolase